MIASFRMYNAVPAAAAAWRALFERVFDEIGAGVQIVEHAAPAPLAALWEDDRLACAFMCGWPFVRSGRAMQPIAAPVPSPPRYAHLPRYCSEFLVREGTGWTRIEETFGSRFGWTAADSQSGFNAPRAFLAGHVDASRPSLYREVRGPLGAPMKALEGLKAGDVDVIALDSYFLDLCRHHEPRRMSGLRTIAATPWTPIPLLVAAPQAQASLVARLRDRLVTLHESPGLAPLLANVIVERFVPAEVSSYRALDDMAAFAASRGYEAIR